MIDQILLYLQEQDKSAVKTIPANTQIVDTNDEISEILFLQSGVASHQIIGDIAFLASNKTYGFSSHTYTECEFISIKSSVFKDLIDNNSTLSSLYATHLAKFILNLNTPKTSLEKIKLTLINLCQNQQDSTVFIDLSREELAKIAGVSLRSLIRGLNSLNDDNLITFFKKTITISTSQQLLLKKTDT